MKKIIIICILFINSCNIYALSITDLKKIKGQNPTPSELNTYILQKCNQYKIPPIIVRAILLREGLGKYKWKQYSFENGYDHDTIVYGEDKYNNSIVSYGLGLFQITYKVDANGNFTGNEAEIKKVVSSWKYNVDKAFEKLWSKWQKNIENFTGPDVNPRIIENWFYPIAWYNGSGSDAKIYVDAIYAFMKDKSKVWNELASSYNANEIYQFYNEVPDITAPYIIPEFQEHVKAISASKPFPYTLQKIYDNGGSIHIWQNSTYEEYSLTNDSIGSSENIAWGFDYPFGTKGYDKNGNKVPIDEKIKDWGNGYSVDRNEEYNLRKGIYKNNSRYSNQSKGWYNISDVGNFLNLKYTKGLHPGEDWNYNSGKADAGKPIYAVANGRIVYIQTTYSKTTAYGWTIVLEHILPDNSKIYSIYTHVTSDNYTTGTITSSKSKFKYQIGTNVTKGNIIARIANISKMSPHLHFEIRDSINLNNLYPNDNGNGYYSHNKAKVLSMTAEQVKTAMNLMRKDGILDPSDFIDDHRDIYVWTGNGSIISYHNETHTDIDNSTKEYPFGTTKDISKTHSIYNIENHRLEKNIKQASFFQWQVSRSCEQLKIDHNGLNNKVDITIGTWSPRKNDITFRNVQLPFVIGRGNTGFDFKYNGHDWYVIGVTFNKPTKDESSQYDVANKIYATCTNESSTNYKGLKTAKPIIIGSHQWNGNGSIITDYFKNYQNELSKIYKSDDWPYGISRDVTMVHPSPNKPVIFFQWMHSEVCKNLMIDIFDDKTKKAFNVNEKYVHLSIKNWSDNTFRPESTCRQLPCKITVSASRKWSVIKVAFDRPITRKGRVKAYCMEFFKK